MDYIRNRSHLKNALGLLVFPSLIFLVTGCAETQEEMVEEKREFSLPVQIGKVVYLDVVDQIRTVGNIQAEQRVVITSEVKGQIKRLFVEEGKKVKAGQRLAQIDTREYELEADRLQTDLAKAEKEYEKAQQGARPEDKLKLQAQVNADASALSLAKKELARTQQLVAEGVVSQAALDQAVDKAQRAEDALQVSKAELAGGMKSRDEDIAQNKSELEGIKKRLEMAKLDLSKTVIRAPFDGVIISKRIEQGAFASSGTAILEMIGSSRLKAVIEIPQGYRNKLAKMESAEFLIKELNLKFKPNGNLAKHVRVIPDANIYSGNIKVQIDLSHPPKALFPGLTLESNLTFGARRNVMHVPSVSLVITEQGTVVYIVKDERAHLVPVKAFKERNQFVEIEDFTHQLGPDADLILRGSGAVFPGAKVFQTNPQPEAKPPFNAAAKESRNHRKLPESPET